MTKLRIMSDLHLEFGSLELEPIGEDALVLGGDIGLGTTGAKWAIEYASRTAVPIIMIAGNHEFYQQSSVDAVYNDLYRLAAHHQPLLQFLQDDVRACAGVTFAGCTLWTDYDLNGDAPVAMANAATAMNDHRLIRETPDRIFAPGHALSRHRASVTNLRERLSPRDLLTPIVVMTHHLPSRRSIAGRYADSHYNAAYASNLDDLVAASGAKVWVHGHTHVSQDYMIGETRVICNPRGYDCYELNPDFNPNLIVKV